MANDDSWLHSSWAERWGLVEHPHRDGILLLLDAHSYLWADKSVPVEIRIGACNLLYELAEELIWE